MNPEQTLELFKYLGLTWGYIIAGSTFLIVSGNKLWKHLDKRLEHRSAEVGIKAMEKVMENITFLQDDMEKLRKSVDKNDEQLREVIQQLSQHLHDFMMQVTKLFGTK